MTGSSPSSIRPSAPLPLSDRRLSYVSPIHHLDVKNAFLYGHLEETVLLAATCHGFLEQSAPNYAGLLQHSLYGLKKAPQAWYQRAWY